MLMISGAHVCPRKDIVCGEKPENWCGECPLGRPDPLRDLVAALRREASEQEAQAKRINPQGMPVYNPIQWGRAEAKRDAADRIEAALDEAKGRQG